MTTDDLQGYCRGVKVDRKVGGSFVSGLQASGVDWKVVEQDSILTTKKMSFGFKHTLLLFDLIKRFDGFHATNSVFFSKFLQVIIAYQYRLMKEDDAT